MPNVYVIFDKKINKNVIVKVFSNQNEKIDRIKSLITSEDDEAKYFDFIFDKRSNIDRDFKIVMG